MLLRLVLRLGLVLSLVASALVGALIATELRPVRHAVAARQPSIATPVPKPAPPLHTPVATPAPPARAMLAIGDGRATPYGAWIQAHAVTLRITLTPPQKAATLHAEAEVQPADLPFTGKPNASGPVVHVEPGVPIQTAITVTNLMDGQRYHWRVRALAADGKASSWSGDGLFGVSASAPLPPQLATTNVHLGDWIKLTQPLFRWTDAGSRLPISYYEYAIVAGMAHHPDKLSWQHARGSVLALPAIAEGSWHVFVRAIDVAGSRSKPAEWSFGIARHGPSAPRIVAATPQQGAWSNIATPEVHWTAAPSPAPVRSYEYALSFGNSGSDATVWKPVTFTRLALPQLADGDWYLRLRSIDAAGNHSPMAKWSFHLDRQRPLLTAPSISAKSFTPPVERLHVRFGLGKAATLTYRIYVAGTKTPIFSGSLGSREPGQVRNLMWNGYIAPKKLAPAGAYTITIEAVDRAGNRSEITSAPVRVLDKRIVISLSKEALWAYQGNKLLLHTLVTNGGPDTPTIPGIFHVLGKYRGWVFHSPWPAGSPLWYPDSPTSFALLYQAQGGYFLHDAPWRSNFGPGSNSVAGSPGGSYTGTHGCTNVPYDKMAVLFNWADTGTLIQITR